MGECTPYILTGAVQHLGMGGGSGHYICITKDVQQNCYLKTDDHKVTRLTTKEAMHRINISHLLIFCKKDSLERQLVGTTGDHMLGVTSLQIVTKIMNSVL